MTKYRGAILVCIVAMLALFLGACGSDESREDANDVHNGLVEKSAPHVIAFNNHYPNVETKCDGFGHRIYVTTHDSAVGQNFFVIPDPSCQGPGTSYSDILRSGQQPPISEPQAAPTPPITVSP